MRNIFRRQATTAPTLRERATALRASFHPSSPATTALPAPGSDEAKAAWQAACHQHSIRTAHLREHPGLVRGDRDVWSTQSLARALETGEIDAAEFARLHPIASERDLRFNEIAHELNIGALFALAYVDEYPAPQQGAAEPDDKPADLSRAIIDGWKAWEATLYKSPFDAEAEAALERASDLRDKLIYAAMALPATPESIPAKALACAWMEWVNAERPSQSRDDYGPADQLVYDINATISGGTATKP